MRDLAKSIGSFTWAMSLFGARQLAHLFKPSEAAEAFDGVTRETAKHLGEELESTFELGDRMQRSMVDLSMGVVSFNPPDPDEWARASTQMAEGFADMARRMAGMARSWSERAAADEGGEASEGTPGESAE